MAAVKALFITLFIFISCTFALDPNFNIGVGSEAPYVRKMNCELPRSDPLGEQETCDVLILGGGWGGVHTAYILAMQKTNTKICLVELKDFLGGRAVDINGPVSSETDKRTVGECPVRIQDKQIEMRCLINELGVPMEQGPTQFVGTIMRGIQVTDTDEFGASGRYSGVYKGLPDPEPDNCGLQCDLTDYLRGATDVNPLTGELDPAYSECANYATQSSYVRNKLSPEAAQYLRDASGFKGEFYDWNPCMFWEFINSEHDRCCDFLYPRGGHSQIITSMERSMVENGVKVFKNEAVECISRGGSREYKVRTARRYFEAKKVVVAIPNAGVVGIGGDIAENLISQQEFTIPKGVGVFTMPTWWPERWWESLKQESYNTLLVLSNNHCFTRAEFYGVPYLIGQNASRAVYCDDPNCVRSWKETWDNFGEEGLIEELLNQYRDYFPDINIPRPTKVAPHYIDHAWFYPASNNRSFTNQHVSDWAVAPLGNEEDICLVTDAFNINYSAWGQAAVIQSLKCIERMFKDIVPQSVIDSRYDCGSRTFDNEFYPPFAPDIDPFGLDAIEVDDDPAKPLSSYTFSDQLQLASASTIVYVDLFVILFMTIFALL